MERLEREATHRYVPAYELAGAYLALGNDERALALLQRALDERSHSVAFLNVDPRFDGLRAHAALAALMGKVGFVLEDGTTGKG